MKTFGEMLKPNLYVEVILSADDMPEEFSNGFRQWSFVPSRLLDNVDINEVTYSDRSVRVAKIDDELGSLSSYTCWWLNSGYKSGLHLFASSELENGSPNDSDLRAKPIDIQLIKQFADNLRNSVPNIKSIDAVITILNRWKNHADIAAINESGTVSDDLSNNAILEFSMGPNESALNMTGTENQNGSTGRVETVMNEMDDTKNQRLLSKRNRREPDRLAFVRRSREKMEENLLKMREMLTKFEQSRDAYDRLQNKKK